MADVRHSFFRFRLAWLATESGNRYPGEALNFGRWPEKEPDAKRNSGVDFEATNSETEMNIKMAAGVIYGHVRPEQP